MKWNFIAVAVLLTAPALTVGPASAQQLSAQDFAKKVAISDMFEIQSGQLAVDKAQNEDVQSFGQEMVDAHTETSEDLRQLVKDENINVELPTQLDQDHQAKLDQLKKSPGNKFDHTYVSQQVQAHQTAVKLFENYSKNGDQEELKEWADDTLPTLQKHLKDAQALNADLKAAPAVATDDRKGSESRTALNDEAGPKRADQSTPADIKFVTQQQPKDWSAQALIGRTVENAQGDNLGQISNVILDERGSVVAVTIGVGGFLGIGEKDVGVPFNALQFKAEERVDTPAPADNRNGNERKNATATRHDSEHDNVRIVLNATQEQLEKAPRFVWLGEQDRENASDERVIR